MAFRRDRETKETVPAVKAEVKQIQKIKKTKTPVHKPAPVAKAEPVEKTKNAWHGIGIIGMNEDISTFKSKLKKKNLKLGEVVMNFIIDWNSKN